jgi:hypothetical protein
LAVVRDVHVGVAEVASELVNVYAVDSAIWTGQVRAGELSANLMAHASLHPSGQRITAAPPQTRSQRKHHTPAKEEGKSVTPGLRSLFTFGAA